MFYEACCILVRKQDWVLLTQISISILKNHYRILVNLMGESFEPQIL